MCLDSIVQINQMTYLPFSIKKPTPFLKIPEKIYQPNNKFEFAPI